MFSCRPPPLGGLYIDLEAFLFGKAPILIQKRGE